MAERELRFPYPVLNGQGTLTPTIRDQFATNDSPKLKFNHFVKFFFRPNLPNNLTVPGQVGGLDLETNFLALKQTGRITPVINYADVNYYGYRTKVATKTDYSVLNMTFYDDSSNRAHSIIDTYMEAVSPLTRATNANDLEGRQTIGALEQGSKLGIIEEIRVKQTSHNQNTTYRFYNPKITNIMADELDMTVSDVSTISLSFVFDAYHVEKEAISVG